MNDGRREPRSRPSLELNSRRHLPTDMPSHSKTPTGWRSARPESSPYFSSAQLARQRWGDPRADGNMDFEARMSEYPRRRLSPNCERRPPFGGTMLGDGGSDRRRPYSDECDELSLESYDYRPGRHGDSERFSGCLDRPRRPLGPPPFDPDRGRPFGYDDRPRPSFGPSRRRPEEKPFEIPEDVRDRPLDPRSPHGGRPRFNRERELEAPPGAPSIRPGDGDRGRPHPSGHRGTPPNAGSWRAVPFGFEDTRGIRENRADSLPFRGDLRESWHPRSRGPNREDFRDTGKECSPPPHFRQRPEGCMDLDLHPPDSSEHRGWDNRERATSDYCKQPVQLRDYDHWGSNPRELKQHGQVRPDAPYCDERPSRNLGVGGNPFQLDQSEGNSRGRSSADEEPLPGMRDPRETHMPCAVSQKSTHDSHSGSAYEEQLSDRCQTRPALSNVETRGDANQGAAPGSQERPTNLIPRLPNIQKKEETGKTVHQEVPHNTDSSGWPNRQNSGETDTRSSGIHERAIEAVCLWPNLPKTGEEGPTNSDSLQRPIDTECKAQLPVGFRGIQTSSQGPPAASIPPVQFPSPNAAVIAPLGPSISQHSRNAGQTESGAHQRLPISLRQQQQQQVFPVGNLQPSAPADLIWQLPQSLPFIGNIPQLPTQPKPQNPPPTCLDSVERPLGMMEGGGFKQEKSSIPSDCKLQPPPSPPWLRARKELCYQELCPSFQAQVVQGDKSGGPQCQMASADKKPPASPIGQHPPQFTSKVSCGPRRFYGPDYPQGDRQPPVSESQPNAASPPAVSSLPEQPSTSPPISAAPQQMTTTSANVVQLDSSVPTPLKSQEPRPLTTAYPKVRFSLPSPLLAQGQARFPAPANQEGTRACAPHASVSHTKSVSSGDAKHPAASPTVQGKPGDQPSAEEISLKPPPGIPSFFAGSLQGPGTATSVPQPAVSPINFQCQQAITEVNQKQRSPAADCQAQVASALPSSKLGGNVGKIKQGKSKSPSDLYGPKVPNPTAAIQVASTAAQGGSSEVGMMDIDADGAGVSVQSNKTEADVGHSTLPVKMLENQPAPKTANQVDESKKNEIQSQNTGSQQKNGGLKKQQPLIMKRAANQMKKAAELENTDTESEKRETTVGSKGSLIQCDPGTTHPPKPPNGTGESPSKERGSGLKKAEEDMGNLAASVTKQTSTSTVREEMLRTAEITENDEILVLDEDEAISSKDGPLSSDPVVNDQEVSSSTPESSDGGTPVGEGKTGDSSKEPNANSPVTAGGGDSCDKKRKLSQGSGSPVTKLDVTSDSEQSECSSSKKSTKPRSPSPKKASSRASRTYSSDDDSEYAETRNEAICLSGRGNEGQIFGIPVVFKAISTTRTFWNIRGSQVSRELEQIIGENIVNQKINRAGFLCVNVATAADAVKLLNIKKLGGANVETVIPSMYLRHEAKIRGVPYHYTNEQLIKYFSDVGVVDARRQLTVKRLHDGSFEEYPRGSVILTFKPDATLPRMLELGPDRFIVEEYIEAPLQCFKCLRFGHTARDCVSVSRCKNCGARYCQEDCERKTPMCANCFGPHPATYVGCPRRREVAFASLWKKAFDLNAL